MSTKKKLYLVDDDAFFLQLLQLQLSNSLDVEIESFTTGEAVLEAIGGNPDLIVLDYYLDKENPDAINGMETWERIKANNESQKVIILSGQDNFKVVDKLFDHGITDYVIKDEFAFNTLIEKVKKML